MVIIFVPLIIFWMSGKAFFVSSFWFPFDKYDERNYAFAILWMNWQGYSLITYLLISDIFLYACVTIISMEFNILKHEVKNFKLQSPEGRKVNVVSFIERHVKLRDLSDQLQGIFGPIFLYTFITGSILMCLILFHFLTTKVTVFTALIDIIYLETIVTQTWLLCFYGQKLIDSSSGVADAIYDSDWTEVDDCYFKKQIVLILIRSQRPKRLSAMGFADISLETFAAVSNLVLRRFIYQLTFLLPQILSSTYSYFSLLRTVFSENWNVKVLCRRETNKLRTMSAYIREIIQRLQQ